MSISGHIIRACVATLLAIALGACGGDSRDKLLSSARDFVAKDERNAAIIQLKNLLQKSPDDAEARLLLGQTYYENGDHTLAEIELRRALELEQPADQVMPVLARVIMARAQPQRLLDEFGNVKLRDRSAISEFRAALGEAYLYTGKYAEAKAQFEGALSARGDNRAARLGLALLDAAQGNLAAADRKVDELLSAHPDYVEARELKADLQLRQGDRPAAKKTLLNLVAVDPRNQTANLLLAGMLIDEGAYDEAATRLAAVRSTQTVTLRLTFLQGLLALRKGELQKAREHVVKILGPMPQHIPSLVMAGAIELEAGQFASAEAYLRRVLSVSPLNDPARRLLVGVYTQSGQAVRAREILEELLLARKAPDSELLMLAGETYLANGDLKRAADYFKRASAGDAAKADARTKLGQLALATGNPEAGFRELEAATQIDPQHSRADIARIVAHLERNEIDAALAAAIVLEKKRPQSPVSHHLLGIVHMSRKDIAAARKSLEHALELQPSYLPSAVLLSRFDLSERKPERAKKRFEGIIEKDPKNDEAYVLLAELQARTGSPPEDVRKTLQRAVAANPGSARARVALMSAHLHMKDRKAALAAAQEAIVAIPNDPSLFEAVAALQERAGEKVQALDTLEKLIALQPRSPQPLQRLADFQVRQRNYERALDALRRARILAPDNRELVREYAAVSVAAGKTEDALREARDLQRREPKYAGGYAIEGEVQFAAKNYGAAEKAYVEALKVEPRGTALATRLYSILLAANRSADADAFASRWTKENPKDTAFRAFVAQIALAAKNYTLASAQYRAIVEIEPKNAGALNNLAWSLGELGDPKALQYAERAAALAPRSAPILDTLGTLLVRKGEVSKGLDYLDRAVKIDSDAPRIRLSFAKALLQAGHMDAARKQLEILRDIPGDFSGRPEAEALLKKL